MNITTKKDLTLPYKSGFLLLCCLLTSTLACATLRAIGTPAPTPAQEYQIPTTLPTITPIRTATFTRTPSPVISRTATQTFTPTQTPTYTPEPTETPTDTLTPRPSRTVTARSTEDETR